ncbi:MAG: kelch repeat-containing protein [Planctomycetota bacterium]
MAGVAHGDWKECAPLPQALARASAAHILWPGDEGMVVASGGLTAVGSTTDAIWGYEVSRDQWRRIGRLATPRCNHASVALANHRVLVIGGQSATNLRFSGGLRSTEFIEAATGRSIPGPDLPAGMRSPTAHLMPDGSVVAIGGDMAAVMDRPLGHGARWRGIPLRESRHEHASVVLDDRRVAVVGGQGTGSIEVVGGGASVMRKARLPDALDDHRVWRLPDGRLWVLGGQLTFRGRTTDQTWVVDLDGARVIPGPALGHAPGVADAGLWVSGEGSTAWLAGGESDEGGDDRELRRAWRLVLGDGGLRVERGPDLPGPVDDAAWAVLPGGEAVSVGGVVTRRLLGRSLPTPVSRVVRYVRAGRGEVAEAAGE